MVWHRSVHATPPLIDSLTLGHRYECTCCCCCCCCCCVVRESNQRVDRVCEVIGSLESKLSYHTEIMESILDVGKQFHSARDEIASIVKSLRNRQDDEPKERRHTNEEDTEHFAKPTTARGYARERLCEKGQARSIPTGTKSITQNGASPRSGSRKRNRPTTSLTTTMNGLRGSGRLDTVTSMHIDSDLMTESTAIVNVARRQQSRLLAFNKRRR